MIYSNVLLLINILFLILFFVALYDRLINGKYYSKNKLIDQKLMKNFNTIEEYQYYKNMLYQLIEQYETNKSRDLFYKLTKNPSKQFINGIIYGILFTGTIVGGITRGLLFAITGPVLEYFLG